MKTRTGGFPIGFRIGPGEWQQDLTALAGWARTTGFELIDLGAVGAAEIRKVRAAGVQVVSADLHDWWTLLSEDEGKRKAAVEKNIAHMRAAAAEGVRMFFSVVIPENAGAPPLDNFRRAVATYAELAATAESLNAVVVLEGWPGMPPKFANFCCNPETCRAMLKEVPSRGLGLNYDPSHLIRMGIDHMRFLDEFADRVGHVHGKDTEILTENLYEIGHTQTALFSKAPGFGQDTWRYTIPGHGQARWSAIFARLQRQGYTGAVCVELEDADYNGTTAGEQAGLIASLEHLRNA